jgi:ribosomal protein S27AE
MSNVVKNVGLWLEQWLELFLTHYKYWDDYKSSTLLVDWGYNIIWFFNHKTPKIDIVMIELPFQWNFQIRNWKMVKWISLTKYKPLDNWDYNIKYLTSLELWKELEFCPICDSFQFCDKEWDYSKCGKCGNTFTWLFK